MKLILEDLGNHPDFEGVTVELDLRGLFLNLDAEVLDLPYVLRYFKNGVDISEKFTKVVPTWDVRNNQLMMVRDENFQPIPNPDYVEKLDDEGNVINAEEMFIRQPAFTYMATVIEALLGNMVRAYIAEEHQDGKFIV